MKFNYTLQSSNTNGARFDPQHVDTKYWHSQTKQSHFIPKFSIDTQNEVSKMPFVHDYFYVDSFYLQNDKGSRKSLAYKFSSPPFLLITCR